METITFHHRVLRLGTPGTPLHLETIAPPALPSGWQETDVRRWCKKRDYGRGYVSTGGLQVLLDATLVARTRWLHVSVSHRGGRLPTWREMCQVKDTFCGEGRTAYQIHPPVTQHISLHPACLHLWCPLDGPVTPDFTGGGDTI